MILARVGFDESGKFLERDRMRWEVEEEERRRENRRCRCLGATLGKISCN